MMLVTKQPALWVSLSLAVPFSSSSRLLMVANKSRTHSHRPKSELGEYKMEYQEGFPFQSDLRW